ncbi:phosphotransferase [Lysobacter sp. A03]|uniref:phosphotransferase enzyme family protein n=1 Tax=Lysobacter sp. A03 TaxID=1199154 RepID=UPI0005B6AD56|nr:phosphotransferase [Lysobacter sp. A03]KIQ97216.1 putative homoserine kinase type II, PnuC-associated, THI-regulated branch [Lysobacter sp. A03]
MNASDHLVQGLRNDAVAADWPAISDSEIAWLSGRFPQIDGDSHLLWHSPRPMSAAAIVDSRAGRVFVKRQHRSVRTAASLTEEHRFIAHLAAAGVSVVHVLPDHGGSTALERGDWTYEVHAVGTGLDLYRDAPSWAPLTDLRQAWEAGGMLATLHRGSTGYSAPQRSTHLLVARDDLIRAADPIATLKRQLHDRPALADYLANRSWQNDLRQSMLPWHAGIAARLQTQPVLWAHNDWHASNLLWRREGDAVVVDTVFDFGLASPTSALFDLATAIERNAIAWLAPQRDAHAVHADTALALLDGYRRVLPLSSEQVHLLADLLPVVHVDFALSEVDYFHGVTGSRADADLAYHDFLLGHADWFRTDAGQSLLALLHAAA